MAGATNYRVKDFGGEESGSNFFREIDRIRDDHMTQVSRQEISSIRLLICQGGAKDKGLEGATRE